MTAIPRSVALAAATATALTATAFAIPATAADSASAPRAAAAIDLTDGTLDWGVKQSFRNYVTGIAMGKITAADGATQADGNGVFTFTGGTGTYDTGSHSVDTSFDGSVNFVSTIHGFDIKLADLQFVTSGRTAGRITADVTLNGETSDDVDLAELDLSEVSPGRGAGGEMTFEDIPATLTADGAAAFNGMYEAGTALDPATLSVKTASGGSGGTTGGGETGGSGDPGSTGGSAEGSTGGSATGGSTGGATGGSTGGATGSTGSTGDGSTGATGGDGGAKDPADAGTVADGNLDWGVKESFRKYVVGPIGKGKVELTGDAEENGDIYRFPKGSGDYDLEKNTLDVTFGGGVAFYAHAEGDGYQLELKFSELKVEVAEGGSSLVADVSSKDRESGEVTEYDDLKLASLIVPADALDPDGDLITLSDVPASLTAAGAEAFGGFYEAGEALDPITATVALSDDAELPGGSGGSSAGSGGLDPASTGGTGGAGTVGGAAGAGGSVGGALASTGATSPSGTLLGGAAVLATIGAAAVYATRRRSAES